MSTTWVSRTPASAAYLSACSVPSRPAPTTAARISSMPRSPPSPHTVIPALAAALSVRARSRISACPASTPIIAAPISLSSSIVAGPIAGRSKRRSWPGLAALATTRPRPHSAAARRRAASVPSTASIAPTTPSRTATAWPTSKLPSARITPKARCRSLSCAAVGSGPAIRPRPASARRASAPDRSPRSRRPRSRRRQRAAPRHR